MDSKQHEPHPDCPDTLACLPDTEGRPQHTLPVILRCAILGSPRKCLTIRDIYAAMEDKYAYYKTAGPTWKQSVRHHLSLNRLFERRPRPVTDPGFGSYWTVNLTAPPGTKRPRKRGRPNKDIHDDTGPPPPVKRGRLQKEGGNEEEKDDGGHITEEEFESEEDMLYPFAHAVPSATTSASIMDGADNLIDRLQIEMAGLRRQSSEAMLRVSDQLAEAQAEASRAKAALRMAENMLQDEARKRREAERAVDEEAKRRRAAEEALRNQLSASITRPC